ncbi:hypothetical protein TanjilG_22374 [Lupinus angustifolius]|uniref:Uncharacterized protein n=1 Tax=Lupinus angustifolius TaxID=3871 RepID=A0A4P1RSG5_LUPAN|nr:hypothetical protein TanjilG_22374 [Lupinus angustifolius]
MRSNLMGGGGAIRNHEERWLLCFSVCFEVGIPIKAEFIAIEQGGSDSIPREANSLADFMAKTGALLGSVFSDFGFCFDWCFIFS